MKKIVLTFISVMIGAIASAQTILYTYDKSGRLTSYSASDTTYREYTYDQMEIGSNNKRKQAH